MLSSLIFLGLLDFSFNIQNGMYTISLMDMLLNAFINLWCVVFGIIIAINYRKAERLRRITAGAQLSTRLRKQAVRASRPQSFFTI